jgi:hypothetical protein
VAMPMEDHSRAFCAYLRVSTDRQGKSGLGLEAQQAAIDAFLKGTGRLTATFTCPPSEPMRRTGPVEEPRISGSS